MIGRAARPARRRSVRRHRLAPGVMAAGLLMGAGTLATLGAAAWERIHRVPALAVRSVQVHGLARLDAGGLRELVLPLKGRPLSEIDADALRERIEALPGIAAASVGKVLPDTLSITVRERPAVAVARLASGPALIDAQGARIGPAAANAALPELADLSPDGAGADPALAAWAAALAAAPAPPARIVRALREPAGVRAELADGVTLRLPLEPAELPAALARWRATDPARLPGWGPGARLDVRFNGQVWYLPPPASKSPESSHG